MRMKTIRLAVTAVALAAAAGSAQALEWGTAGVMSQRGQKLKVAIPFRSNVDEHLSVVQFSVSSSMAEVGSFSPNPETFTIYKAPGTNLLILQSAEHVHAGNVSLVLRVASQPDNAVRYELKIPAR